MTSPDIGRFALRIAGELRARSTETPRSYLFTLRDDKHLRIVDQTIATGRRVLLIEAYRGSAAVYGQYPAVRFDGDPAEAWFGDSMSARDEGTALTVLENAIVTQLEGADFARHDADVTVDVRDGTTGAAPYAPRFRPVDYARVLARGPLLLAYWAFVVAWIAFAAGGLWASYAGPSPTVTGVTVVGVLLPQLLAVIAVIVAGYAGRGGNGTRTLVLALLSFIWLPLAQAMPVGPFLTVAGGALLAAAAASAAAVRVVVPVVAYVAVALVAASVGSNLFASTEAPVGAYLVTGLGMIVATTLAAALIRRASARAATL